MQFSDSLSLVNKLCIKWSNIAQVPWETIFLGYFYTCAIGTLAKISSRYAKEVHRPQQSKGICFF